MPVAISRRRSLLDRSSQLFNKKALFLIWPIYWCQLPFQVRRRPLRDRSSNCSIKRRCFLSNKKAAASRRLLFPDANSDLFLLIDAKGGRFATVVPNCPFLPKKSGRFASVLFLVVQFIYASCCDPFPGDVICPIKIACRRWPLRGAEKGTERFYFLVPRINRKERTPEGISWIWVSAKECSNRSFLHTKLAFLLFSGRKRGGGG